MSAYGVGFAVTTAVMVCEGLFGSSAVWFMFKSVGKRFSSLTPCHGVRGALAQRASGLETERWLQNSVF